MRKFTLGIVWAVIGIWAGRSAEAASGPVQWWAFVSPMCGPCRQMEPALAQLEAKGVPLRRIDITRQPELARKLGIQAVPCFVLVRGDQVLERIVGATSPAVLEGRYRQAVGETAGADGSQELALREDPAARGELAPRASQEPPSAAGQSGVRTYARTAAELLAATVRLRVRDGRGHSCGSGTLVDAREGEALVLTCGHIFRDSQGRGRIEVDLFAPEPVENVPGRLLAYDLVRDLGLVVIRTPMPVVVARIAPAGTAVREGMAVISVGCDQGSRPRAQYTRIVAVNKYIGPANIVVAGMPAEGRSGGGLFTEEGYLVGVCNAADPADKEGLFAALPTIHELLDSKQLAFVYRGPWPAALGWASTAGGATAPGALGWSGARGPAPGSVAAGGSRPAQSPEEPALGPSPSQLTPSEEALLARIAQHLYQGGELLCVLRGKGTTPDRGEVLELEGLSPAFWARLANMVRELPQKTSCQLAGEEGQASGPAAAAAPAAGRGRVLFEFRCSGPADLPAGR